MLPEGWVKSSLEDVAEIRTGVAKGKRNLKDPVFMPYLRVANVQDGYLDLNEIKKIEVSAKDIERYSLRLGDIVLTEGGDFDKLGRGTIWRGQIAQCLHQNHVFAVRVNSEHLLPEYLAALTSSNYGKAYFLTCAKRSTNLASINSTQLKQFPAIVPPLLEQKKIAEILSTWDKAIATTEKLLANAEAQKKALMQQLLTGKRRLKGCEGAWQRAKLIKLVELQRGFDLPSTQRVDGPYPVISSSGHSGQHCEAKVKGPGIVTGRYGSIGEFFFVEGDFWPLNTTLWVKNFHSNDPLFAYYFLQSIDLKKHSGKTGVPGINRNDIHAIAIQFPPPDEQRRIAEVLKVADSEIRSHTNILLRLVKEKQALMQQLLTGKRRVSVR